MATAIRELVLMAYARHLGAARNPYVLEYESARLVALYDEAETVTSDYTGDTHTMTVRITAVDALVLEDNRSAETNALLAWLHQTTVSNRTLTGLCEDIRIAQAAPIYSEDPSGFIGAIVEATILYRTALNDPYTAAP